MRFMMLYKPGKEATAPPSAGEIAAMGALIQEMAKASVLLSTEGLQPSSKGARISVTGGGFSITEGPFPESKELIAGYAVVQVKSKQEAIEWAKRFLKVVGKGESEIREMYDAPALAPS